MRLGSDVECRDWLGEYIRSHLRRLLITLGNEATAFIRGDTAAKEAQIEASSKAVLH